MIYAVIYLYIIGAIFVHFVLDDTMDERQLRAAPSGFRLLMTICWPVAIPLGLFGGVLLPWWRNE